MQAVGRELDHEHEARNDLAPRPAADTSESKLFSIFGLDETTRPPSTTTTRRTPPPRSDRHHCRVQLGPQRYDQRILCRVGKLAKVGKRRSVSHPYLDSHSRSAIKEKINIWASSWRNMPSAEPPGGSQVSNYNKSLSENLGPGMTAELPGKKLLDMR